MKMCKELTVRCCQAGAHLGALRVGEHAGDAADEALTAGGVPAAEAVARLLEVVLLLDDALLPLPRDEGVVDGVPLRMAHRVKARREVVHLLLNPQNSDSVPGTSSCT